VKKPKSKKCTCKVCGKQFDHPWQIAQHHKFDHPQPKKAKAKKARAKKFKELQFEVNSCPVCSCNIGDVRAVTGREVHCCPDCRCNLDAVTVAINM